jgi:hypothetical protein
MLQINDPTDRIPFFNSTYIQVGNGRNTPFWEAKWIQGAAPKDLAPGLFKSARFKKWSVYSELKNSNWIRNLEVIDSPGLLDEYVNLFLAVPSFSLSEQADRTFWRWTPDEHFTVSLAYDCQFRGAISLFPASDVWKAYTESKIKFLPGWPSITKPLQLII